MSYTTPNYGIVVPSPSTRLNRLGVELQQMGMSIEEILESFDYNGADPNLVLTRVAALEAWRTAAAARLAALEYETEWTPISLNSPYEGTAEWRFKGDEVQFRCVFSTQLDDGVAIQVLTMPTGARPLARRPMLASGEGIRIVTSYIDEGGIIRIRTFGGVSRPYISGSWERT